MSQKKSPGDTSLPLAAIEIALARYFDYAGDNVVAFNVHGDSWLFPLTHEADMLVLLKDRRLVEVEIKRTWSDFLADFKKKHHHEGTDSVGISRFFYAVPVGILDRVVRKLAEERIIPSGIITYDEKGFPFLHHTFYSFRPEKEGDAASSTYMCAWPRNTGMSHLEAMRRLESGYAFKLDLPGDAPIRFLYDSGARPLFTEQAFELMRLASLRQVSLRERLLRESEEARKDPDEKLRNRVTELEILLREYRARYREDTGGDIDEKEVLFG